MEIIIVLLIVVYFLVLLLVIDRIRLHTKRSAAALEALRKQNEITQHLLKKLTPPPRDGEHIPE